MMHESKIIDELFNLLSGDVLVLCVVEVVLPC